MLKYEGKEKGKWAAEYNTMGKEFDSIFAVYKTLPISRSTTVFLGCRRIPGTYGKNEKQDTPYNTSMGIRYVQRI